MVAARIKRAKELRKLAKERDEEKLLGIGVKYPSALCGNKKHWKGHTSRVHIQKCMDRLRLRSPPLPLDLADRWLQYRNCWARIVAEKNGHKTGDVFLTDINKCLEELQCYYDGPTPFNKPHKRDDKGNLYWKVKVGNPEAFADYVRKTTKTLPKSTISAVL